MNGNNGKINGMIFRFLFESSQAIWFFLPAALGNAVPVIAHVYKWVPFLNKPMDFGLSWKGKRILGDHKTWRGFVFAVLTGAAVCSLQKYLYLNLPDLRSLYIYDFTNINPLVLGSLMGGGAIIGDAVKSFLKRQNGIDPGQKWLIFDQIDYVLGGLAFAGLYLQLYLIPSSYVLVIFFGMHFLSTFISWKLGWKESAV